MTHILVQDITLTIWQLLLTLFLATVSPFLIAKLTSSFWNTSKKEETKRNATSANEVTIEELQQEDIHEDKGINDYSMLEGPFKMILVVNNELGMTKGKIAAQCGHATLGCYKEACKKTPNAVQWWGRLGQAKIAVKIDSTKQLVELWQEARTKGFSCYLVEDAGRTQIAAGSRTVLAIGPVPTKKLDELTGHLKLL